MKLPVDELHEARHIQLVRLCTSIPVPGVLRDINRIVSDRDANIRAQILATDTDVGYLVMDIDDRVAHDLARDISALGTSIKTRILT